MGNSGSGHKDNVDNWFSITGNPIYKFMNYKTGHLMMKYMGYPYPPEHPILLVFLIVLAITIYSIPGIIMAVVLAQMAALDLEKRFHISV